ncbi:GNAT family N-acetyltransferase [Thalassovita taeanensis]|uniref:Acetyltransferase (GNAT) family protein n=1 Tax=Thalassovita taeanensis TaxID=657014 RepID=A0A1H8YYF9_9RHOB|nr:GNAT family N-acetyltransferase [Thalassovita taeanensis]SEP57214.1 Acetyltransferase (GNAT) family protein [Thalassovita taeanensis]
MTALHLAGPEDAARLLPMIAAFHENAAPAQSPEALSAALAPLLEGSPHGVAYLIGPQRAPIGYILLSFGWSLSLGGLTGHVEEVFIRPGVRGRGIGTEVLNALPKALADAGLTALHLTTPHHDTALQRFFQRLHFDPQPDQILMTRKS